MSSILVVDDDFGIVEALALLLEGEGYRVTKAFDGVDALAKLANETPSLVITDYQMPRLDGIGLVTRMRGDPRLVDVPVILMSATMREERERREKSLKVLAVFGKPFAFEPLLSAVRTAIGTPPLD